MERAAPQQGNAARPESKTCGNNTRKAAQFQSETLEQLRQRLPDYLAACGIELRKQGNRLVARCPMHEDAHPSFAVFGHGMSGCGCYPCGFTGDAFAFAIWTGKASNFPDAVRHVASVLGYTLPETIAEMAKANREEHQGRPSKLRQNSAPVKPIEPRKELAGAILSNGGGDKKSGKQKSAEAKQAESGGALAQKSAESGGQGPQKSAKPLESVQQKSAEQKPTETRKELAKVPTLTNAERETIHKARLAFSDALHAEEPVVSEIAASLGLSIATLKWAAKGTCGLGISARPSRKPWLCYTYPHGIKWRNPDPTAKQRFDFFIGAATAPWRMEWASSPEVETVYLTEGESDCLALIEAGLESYNGNACVASPGTSFQESWAELFTSKTVVLCFDRDKAGQEAVARIAPMLEPYAKAVLAWKGLSHE